jgi:hypothetical protein
VGDGSQRVKWLAHVGIARWDDESQQGWKRLGIPLAVYKNTLQGDKLELNSIINEVLSNGDEIHVLTSLQPDETIS